jgi:hypothetical protein
MAGGEWDSKGPKRGLHAQTGNVWWGATLAGTSGRLAHGSQPVISGIVSNVIARVKTFLLLFEGISLRARVCSAATALACVAGDPESGPGGFSTGEQAAGHAEGAPECRPKLSHNSFGDFDSSSQPGV